MSKTNCWQHKRCGRELGGLKSGALGVCPASLEVRLDATHQGKNGGRACWIVAGSLCGGELQGTFAQKFQSCKDCDFYLAVKKEEGPAFVLSATLLSKIKPLRPPSEQSAPERIVVSKE